MGGYVISLNSYQEQLEVENYFTCKSRQGHLQWQRLVAIVAPFDGAGAGSGCASGLARAVQGFIVTGLTRGSSSAQYTSPPASHQHQLTRMPAWCLPAATGKLWHYWMGLSNVSNVWRWADGSNTTGYVSDVTPYGHWYHGFAGTYTTTDCIFAHLSYPWSR
jgi:hypothetical protein